MAKKFGKVTYQNHREYWRSEEFKEKIFGKSWETNKSVKPFIDELMSFPIKPFFPFVAYGSLMDEYDAYRTIGYADTKTVWIPGWQRVFNMGYKETGSFLNVRPVEGGYPESMIAFVKDVSWENLPDILRRERLYNVEEVKTIYVDEDGVTREELAYMVVGDEVFEEPYIQPQLNYLHLCMRGIKHDGTAHMMNNFLDGTACYSQELTKEVPLRVWLQNVNLTNYLLTHKYSSR